MKKIYLNKRRFNYKDFLNWILKILGHYLGFFIYIFLILLFRLFLYRSNFFSIFNWQINYLIYTITIVPFINGFFHISYYETGSLVSRFLMWIFTSINMILIIILMLVY
jgi:hypothetical protein